MPTPKGQQALKRVGSTRRTRPIEIVKSAANSAKTTYSSIRKDEISKKTRMREDLLNRTKNVEEKMKLINEDESALDEEFILNLQKDYQEFLKLNDELKDDRIAYKFGEEDIQDDIQTVKEEIREVLKKSKALDQQTRDQQAKYRDLSIEKETYIIDIAIEIGEEQEVNKERNEKIEQILEEHESEITKQKIEIENLKEEIQRIKSEKMDKKKNEINMKEQSIKEEEDAVDAELNSIPKKIKEVELKREDMVFKKRRLEASKGDLHSSIQTKERTISDLRSKLSDATRSIKRQEDELERAQRENERLSRDEERSKK